MNFIDKYEELIPAFKNDSPSPPVSILAARDGCDSPPQLVSTNYLPPTEQAASMQQILNDQEKKMDERPKEEAEKLAQEQQEQEEQRHQDKVMEKVMEKQTDQLPASKPEQKKQQNRQQTNKKQNQKAKIMPKEKHQQPPNDKESFGRNEKQMQKNDYTENHNRHSQERNGSKTDLASQSTASFTIQNSASKLIDNNIMKRLININGCMNSIEPIVMDETLFSARSRLFICNLPLQTTQKHLEELFAPYGEIKVFLIKIPIAFVALTHHLNAENAKKHLNGSKYKGKIIEVRFAPNQSIVRVRNLPPFVSNEYLYKSFEIFGTVERATVVIDERGKPTGEGFVHFQDKSYAYDAIIYCRDKNFFLTDSMRPCICNIYEPTDSIDGLPEQCMPKTDKVIDSRRKGPCFAEPNTYQNSFAEKYKYLYYLFDSKLNNLETEMKNELDKLDAECEFARSQQDLERVREKINRHSTKVANNNNNNNNNNTKNVNTSGKAKSTIHQRLQRYQAK